MSEVGRTLVDEIIRLVEINRTTINGLAYGEVVFRIHQGRIVEVAATETLRLSAGVQLCPLLLKNEEAK